MKVKNEPNITRNGISVSYTDYGVPTGNPKTAICPGCGEEYEYYESYIKYLIKVKRLKLNLRFCSYNCRNKYCRDHNIDLKKERELEEELSFEKECYKREHDINRKIATLKKEIKEVEQDIFYLAMKDNWNKADFDRDDVLYQKKKNLEKQIKELREERALLKQEDC